MNDKAIAKKNNDKPKVEKASHKPTAGARLISGLALTCAVVAIAISWFVNHQAESKINSVNNELKNVTQSYSQQIINLQQSLKVASEPEHQLMASVNNLQQTTSQLSKQYEHLSKISGRNDKDWVLAEAQYLIRLANFNLQLTHQPQLALVMLKNADKRIASLSDPQLVGLRRALANDVTKLQSLPQVDYTALILKLDALETQSKQLIMQNSTIALQKAVQQKEVLSQKTGWRGTLENSLARLEKLVVIRYHDKPVKPLLSIAEQRYIMQNLQLILQQAQWAALNKQEALYQQSVKQAVKWVKHYYRHDTIGQSFIKNLTHLQTIDVAPQMPDIDDSLVAVKQALMKEHQS